MKIVRFSFSAFVAVSMGRFNTYYFMKKLALITVAAFAVLSSAFAQETPKAPNYKSFMVIGGTAEIDIVEPAKNSAMKYREWGPDAEKKFSIRVITPIPAEQWTTIKYKIKPSADGEYYLSFGVDKKQLKDGTAKKEGVLYDNVKINGKLVVDGDFESSRTKWNIARSKEYPARREPIAATPEHGRWVLKTTMNSTGGTKLPLKKGEVVEVSFDAKPIPADQLDSDMFINLRKFANMGFIDETPQDGAGGWTDEGPKNSFKKFLSKVGDTDFEGVMFRIMDPANNSGSSVLTFRAPNSPTNLKEAAIDFTETPVIGKYIYLLQTASGVENLKEGDSVGAVNINYEDGKKQSVGVRFGYDVGDCWKPMQGRNMKVAYLNSQKKNRGALYISRIALDNDRVVKDIKFTSNQKATWVIVAATVSDKQIITTDTVTPKDNPDWVKADMPLDMSVLKGSALDVSNFLEDKPAGYYGHAIISERGLFSFEKAADRDFRFKGYSFYPQPLFVKGNKEATTANVKKYSELIRRSGYNLVRIGFDHLKSDLRRDERKARYDEIDLLFTELKKQGVYIHLPLAWYDIGTKDYNFYKRNDVKIRAIMGETEARGMWKETAEEQLNHVNPYTGIAWKDDPMFLVFEYYNELTICFNKYDEFEPETRVMIKNRWNEWLEKRYGEISKLNADWQSSGQGRKAAYKSFAEVECKMSGYDWERFCQDMTEEFMAFCEKTVRATGCKAILVQHNLGRSPYEAAMRSEISEAIISNSYYEHPNGIYVPGAEHTCNQNSSIERTADYWRTHAIAKLNDRPIICTEYNHAYWNKHRFEMASLFAPYSAYQNFSALVIHATAIDWTENGNKKLDFFNVKESPAIRSAELLSMCYFTRGDVKPSQKRVDMVLTKDFIENNRNALRGFGGAQMRIPLLTGFAVDVQGEPVPDAVKNVKVKPADIKVYPNGSSEVVTEGWFQEVVDSKDGTFSLEKFTGELRKRGILSADNITDVSKDIYQTDTKQITLDAGKMFLKVATDYSCSVSLHKSEAVDMGALKLVSTSVPATVGVCSLDGRKIPESSRLVFIYATEENNEDAITSADGYFSYKTGKGPVVMRKGKVNAELKLDAAKKYSVYPIALNGERREKLDLEFAGGVLKIEIDNSKLKSGAVAMFEIVAE